MTYSKQQCNVWPNAEVCIWSFFSQITANSNEYAKLHKDAGKGCFGGSKWINITLEEMIHFLGNVLKMSIDDRKLGGYCEYFDESICTGLAEGYSVQLDGFKAWAKDVMTLRRFKQIRSAFHPEPGFALDGDKCHQLRYVINKFNETAMHTFIPGIDMTFDEGGIPLRSRMNPVRQYNKDKPNKYRVDFFVLANNSEKKYFIQQVKMQRTSIFQIVFVNFQQLRR